jgi:hypothetical protein
MVLIGPTGVGKSTVGDLLAKHLAVPLVSLDRIRFGYYEERSYDADKARDLRRRNFEELIQYWQPFDAHAVTRALSDFEHCVFDFGAIHSVYEDPDLFQQVAGALAPYPYVILLLPTSDPDESVRLLFERGASGTTELSEQDQVMWRRIIERFVKHPSNYRLAKQIVYTSGKQPVDIVADILSLLMGSD